MNGAMATPELSVVIVSYRCADHLDRCLTSIDAQRDDVHMEVIVVDNASGDATPEVCLRHPGTVLVQQQENDGFARAANVGMARSSGRAVLVLNPDCVVPADTLRACLDHLWEREDIGVLSPQVLDPHGDLDARCHRTFPTAWSAFCFLTGFDRVLRDSRSTAYVMRRWPSDRATPVDAVSGAFMLMRADALHHVGGFDQQFFMYAEDIDLCMRFKAAGYGVEYWPGAEVIHVGGGSSDSGGRRPATANAAAFRTMAPLVRKHRRGLRGEGLAFMAWSLGEALLMLSRLRRRAYP
jgi:GT2 family glycosyltransferase